MESDQTSRIQNSNSCSKIRNICVLAHVDHGKTTLVDCLLASNGIITQRMAGKLRYMDSRPDEQQRGITMKSSSISLVFKYNEQNYLINVIDSPGHVDFFGEVSTALRVCDGCIIIVDVIEGVCSQTRAALQQAWLARVRPVLVLNKIDRLFVEKKLSALDIYIQLSQTLEQINACVGELFASEVLSKVSSNVDQNVQAQIKTGSIEKKKIFYDWSAGLDDIDDSGVYFSPENGNVLFASAIDGWGFTIVDFARILSKKMGFSESALTKTLWGDFYINPKDKRILKGAQSKAKKPLFVTLVLENLSKIYEKFVLKHDKSEMIKMGESLGVKLLARDVDRSDHRMALIQLFNQWLPLSDSLLKIICDTVPSPCNINEERVERLLSANQTIRFDSLPEQTRMLKAALLRCESRTADRPDVPLIAYVTKMFSFPRESLPQFRVKPLSEEEILMLRDKLKNRQKMKDVSAERTDYKDDDQSQSGDNSNQIVEEEEEEEKEKEKIVFIGFARVFSGTLRRNDWIYVIGPKHDPTKLTREMIEKIEQSNYTLATLPPDLHATRAQIKDLYLLMGRDLEYVEEVHAGHICGIGSLEQHCIKSATLSSTLYCPPFIDNISNAVPILRVAVEPKNPSDMPALINALKMLNQSDPCVDVKIQETGEHVIITTGEVHLERCIVDLKNFLGEDVEFNISDPIVPFRETIIEPPKVDTLNENISEQKIVHTNANSGGKSNTEVIQQMTPNKKFLFKIRAKPLPEAVTETLDKNKETLIQLMRFQRTKAQQQTSSLKTEDSIKLDETFFTVDVLEAIHGLLARLKQQFHEANWPDNTIDQVWSFGPKFYGANLLLNRLKDFQHRSCFLTNKSGSSTSVSEGNDLSLVKEDIRYTYENSFINGFQLCTQSGPLCDEPMMGVCFIVEEWKYLAEDEDQNHDQAQTNLNYDPFGPISGQIMSTVKEVCRRAFQAQPQRLMVAMFSCIIQINADALGKMYAVLGRRHGRILHADLQEGSQTFTVNAVLPVIESFNFANEIRKQTSGKAIPQLSFSHWEIIDIDPFWKPTTEEEYKLYGEKADTENRALVYMNAVRRRKGLHVEEKIVEHAEKQRTLTKNK